MFHTLNWLHAVEHTPKGGSSKRLCFKCIGFGHIARDCTAPAAKSVHVLDNGAEGKSQIVLCGYPAHSGNGLAAAVNADPRELPNGSSTVAGREEEAAACPGGVVGIECVDSMLLAWMRE